MYEWVGVLVQQGKLVGSCVVAGFLVAEFLWGRNRFYANFNTELLGSEIESVGEYLPLAA